MYLGNWDQNQPDETIVVRRSRSIGGAAIGILVLDLWYPLIPGNVANASTFDFPVLYWVLQGRGLEVLEAEPSLLEAVVAGGEELVRQGVRAIVGSCGYLGFYQREAADALEVPTFLSSLLQVPMILASLGPSKRLGILCATSRSLSPELLRACGVDDGSRLVIAGAEELPEFQNILRCTGSLNSCALERELGGLAVDLLSRHPDIGALLLECSDMPPYAWSIQRRLQVPVFDYTTMVNWVYRAVVQKPYTGII
ncbi:MAG: aspartate/glutamate racemase family protein [Thermoleophilia bacterium]|nr:aspartate/glutamate racemase family protein [Thermoleophilia bacterium]